MMTADELHNYFLNWVRSRAETDLSVTNPMHLFGVWNHLVRALLCLPLAAYVASRRPILFWGIGLQTNRDAAFL